MKIREQRIDDTEISGLEIFIDSDLEDGWKLTLIPRGPFRVAQRDFCFEPDGVLGDEGSFLDQDMIQIHELLYTAIETAYKMGRDEQRPDGPGLEEKFKQVALRNAELLYKKLSSIV